MRVVVESEWPELAHKLPPKEPQRWPLDAPAVKREAEEDWGKDRGGDEDINAHPARRIYRKIARIESGV